MISTSPEGTFDEYEPYEHPLDDEEDDEEEENLDVLQPVMGTH